MDKNKNIRDDLDLISDLIKESEVNPPADLEAKIIERINAGGNNKTRESGGVLDFARWFKSKKIVLPAFAAVAVIAAIIIIPNFIGIGGYQPDAKSIANDTDRAVLYGSRSKMKSEMQESDYEVAEESSIENAKAAASRDSAAPRDSASAPEADQQIARKLIKNFNISIQIEDYDQFSKNLERDVNSAGGYVSNMEIQKFSDGRRYGDYTIRIPADLADQTLGNIGGYGVIDLQHSWINDVTKDYHDIEIRIESAQAAEKRYREMYSQADTVTDMIEIQHKIDEIQRQLDLHMGSKRYYDDQVGYSTIRLSFTEVLETKIKTKPGFGDKIQKAFIEGINGLISFLQNTLLWLVGRLPIILVCCGLILIVYVIVKIKKRNKK